MREYNGCFVYKSFFSIVFDESGIDVSPVTIDTTAAAAAAISRLYLTAVSVDSSSSAPAGVVVADAVVAVSIFSTWSIPSCTLYISRRPVSLSLSLSLSLSFSFPLYYQFSLALVALSLASHGLSHFHSHYSISIIIALCATHWKYLRWWWKREVKLYAGGATKK